MKSITEHAPGKLMLSGEWGIMQPGNWCIVAAVNQYIHATVSEHETFYVHAKDLNLHMQGYLSPDGFKFLQKEATCIFVEEAIRIAISYALELKTTPAPFMLTLNADTYLSAQVKYGLGSSAAVTVAVIKALLTFYDLSYSSDTLFKLSSIAHLYAQKMQGSCFDIAASSYMSTIAYRSFDREWLINHLINGTNLPKLISLTWPLLEIRPCPLSHLFHLCVGWTGTAAHTTELIDTIKLWQQTHKKTWTTTTQDINNTVQQLINALNKQDLLAAQSLINLNRLQLSLLATQSGTELETKALKILIEIAQHVGVSAKFSGAGGGDCGIALCPDFNTATIVSSEWNKNGIKVLDIDLL